MLCFSQKHRHFETLYPCCLPSLSLVPRSAVVVVVSLYFIHPSLTVVEEVIWESCRGLLKDWSFSTYLGSNLQLNEKGLAVLGSRSGGRLHTLSNNGREHQTCIHRRKLVETNRNFRAPIPFAQHEIAARIVRMMLQTHSCHPLRRVKLLLDMIRQIFNPTV